MNQPPKSKTEDLVVRIGVRKSPLKGSLSSAHPQIVLRVKKGYITIPRNTEYRERFDELIRGTKFEFPEGISSDRDSGTVDGNKLIRYQYTKRKQPRLKTYPHLVKG